MSIQTLRSILVWLCLLSIGFDIAAHGLHPATTGQSGRRVDASTHGSHAHPPHHTHALHNQHSHTQEQPDDRPHAPTHDQAHHLVIHNRISTDLDLPRLFEIPALCAPTIEHARPEQNSRVQPAQRQRGDADSTQRMRTIRLLI